MRYVVYSFEAKSIQTYVLATNKLKDRVGGSQQIESLCSEGGELDQILDKLEIKNKVSLHVKRGVLLLRFLIVKK